ncbi:MAG TPA: FAD binding domain-containing protein [Anaerolineaceae bacterium]|nr:FAD binding domain-containing protein [Anaerolineaceae bacterium]
MERFQYVRAASIPDAIALLNEPGLVSRPLAGGTDLVLITRYEKVCDRVVDISLIPELHQITRSRDQVVIGAGATFSEVLENSIINETAPLLAQACRLVGGPQIRNMGTLGGNVANAAACADSIPALVCLDAVAAVITPAGRLEWPLSELIVRPNQTRLPKGGLLISFSYTVPPPGSRGEFMKLGRRNALAISRLTVAALGRIDSRGCIAEARLVPGSAAPQICRFPQTEAILVGETPSDKLCREAARQAVAEMTAITGRRWSSEFKEPALEAMVYRALCTVFNLCQAPDGRPQ